VRIQDVFEAGNRLWYTALGNAGPGTGHRMGGMSEFKKDGQITYCVDPNTFAWNTDVPVDTLTVTTKQYQGQSIGTLGYRPSTW
jgi:hypothetical protein